MQDFFFVKDANEYVRIFFSELHYVESADQYVKLVTAGKTYRTKVPLCHIECLLPPDEFCRIHRSYIISLLHTRRFNSKKAFVEDMQLPIGRRYWALLQKKVIIIDSSMTLSKKEIQELFRRKPGRQ